MSLSKWLPCDFEQCHPLLWGRGILVDHWSTISSLSYKLWLLCDCFVRGIRNDQQISSTNWSVDHLNTSSANSKPCENSFGSRAWAYWDRAVYLTLCTNIIMIMTALNGNIFHVTVPLCREPLVISGFSSQMDSNVDFWCFFVVSLNKLLNKHSIGR